MEEVSNHWKKVVSDLTEEDLKGEKKQILLEVLTKAKSVFEETELGDETDSSDDEDEQIKVKQLETLKKFGGLMSEIISVTESITEQKKTRC